MPLGLGQICVSRLTIVGSLINMFYVELKYTPTSIVKNMQINPLNLFTFQ